MVPSGLNTAHTTDGLLIRIDIAVREFTDLGEDARRVRFEVEGVDEFMRWRDEFAFLTSFRWKGYGNDVLKITRGNVVEALGVLLLVKLRDTQLK